MKKICIFLILASIVPCGIISANTQNILSILDQKTLVREIGTVIKDKDASKNKAIYGSAKTDRYGNLTYGTMVTLAAGTYDIDFSLKTNAPKVSEVVANIGIDPIKSSTEGYYREIRGSDFQGKTGYVTFSMQFTLEDTSVITPYVYMVGTSDLFLNTITIRKSASTLKYTLGSQKSYSYAPTGFSTAVGTLVDDVKADHRKALATPKNGGYGFLAFGPYSTYEAPGDHRAIFRLKTDNHLTAEYVAKIEVFNVNGDGVNKFRKLRGTDFAQSNTYQDFIIDYARSASGSLEFKTLSYGTAGVSLSHVTSVGAFTDTKAPTFTDFRSSIASGMLSVSFWSSEALATQPILEVGGKELVFSSKILNNYNYVLSDVASLKDGQHAVKASANDLFGNAVSDVELGVVQVITKDVLPPKISEISITSSGIQVTEASSFDTIQIVFAVNEALLHTPVVLVGEYPAIFHSRHWNRYVFEYAVNDFSATMQSVPKKVSITATDLGDNTTVSNNTSILLHLHNANLTQESEELPANVGEVVNDPSASGGKARQAVSGQAPSGYLQFGPYADNLLKNSFYIAKFRLKTPDNTSTRIYAVIDVVNTNGDGTRSYRQIRGTDFIANDTYQDFEIPFFRTTTGVMEYRVYFAGNGTVVTDKVTVSESVQSTQHVYQSEDLYGSIGDVISDPSASNKKAIFASVLTDLPGTFQFGPYTTPLKQGSAYTAKFRLKTDSHVKSEAIALIDVYDGVSGYREYREIKATDFDQSHAYQDFEIDFMNPSTGNIEFRIFFYGKQDLWADKVEISEIVKLKLPDYESENLPGITGSVVLDIDASGQLARKAVVGVDGEGVVQFGPYDATNLIEGQPYKAVFRLKTPKNTEQHFITLIDVFNGDVGYRRYREIKASDFDGANQYQEFEITFTQPSGGKNMEYRVFFYGKQDIFVDKVTIVEGVYEGLPIYESENLPSSAGVIIRDADASGWKALQYDLAKFSEGWAQFGPYKIDNVTVGENYKAHFRLKSHDTANGDVIAILNVYNSEKGIDLRMPLKGIDFTTPNVYQDFSIEFPMLDTDYMEFRIFATGKWNFSADKIYLSK